MVDDHETTSSPVDDSETGNMSDKELVERLRWGWWYFEDPFDGKAYASDDPVEAADRIEVLSAEVERLREALTTISHEGGQAEAKFARAALGEQP